ncbi:MAG TPA: nitroreductase family protein [Clostridia bacterium]|nr:nitroreductase family protein [Clostridia bacterium]
MTFDELVVTRRSIRQYKRQKVEQKMLVALVNAAIWAPTAGNLQLLHFLVVQDDKKLDRVKLFAPGMPKSAPCAIIICVDIAEAEAKGGALIRKNAPVDTAFAAQNILLKAHELGLGACVVKSYNEKSVGQILKLPGEVAALMLITVGYYDNTPKAPARKSVSEVIHYNGWEGEAESYEQG